MPTLHLALEPKADAFLVEDPLGLLIGMLLDQQVRFEQAFGAPYLLAQRLGVKRLDAAALAAHDPTALGEIFSQQPALHRFPKAMAERAQVLAGIVRDEYDGDAAALWHTAPTGKELVARIKALPGFGAVKAQIFAALLAKQFGVKPDGWREALGEFGVEGSYVSVADIVDDASMAKVREHKQQMKAEAKAAKGAH